MRHGLALGIVLCSGLLLGCFSPQPSKTLSQYSSPPPFEGPTGANVVTLRVVVIERPIGDFALNEEIWKLADEQSLDLEHKILLHENGFRMGQFGSCPPPSLRDLLESDRSCLNPEEIYMRAGNPRTVLLGPSQSPCSFQLVSSGQATPVELDQAQCQLQIVPTLTRDGRIRLQFTPCIKHGQPAMTPGPVKDPGGTLRWEMECRQPLETYTHLSWHQTVSDSDWVVVGTWLDRKGTLGQRCFLETEAPPPVQRLLALRTFRASQPPPASKDGLGKSPAIAAQASLTTVRGTPP